MWKQKYGSNATYNNLIEVFERAGYKDLADSVREMLGPGIYMFIISIVVIIMPIFNDKLIIGCDGTASQVDSASPQLLVTLPPPQERGASSAWQCILLWTQQVRGTKINIQLDPLRSVLITQENRYHFAVTIYVLPALMSMSLLKHSFSIYR